MRTRILLLSVLMTVFAVPVTTLKAQAPQGTRVALLDIEEVFENYRRYKAMLGDVRKDEEVLAAEMRGKAKAIQTMLTELKDYRPGTAAYTQLETRIAKLKADGTVQADIGRKAFIIRRAQASHAAYQEITSAVSRFSEANGINLVLAFDNREVDSANPNQVLTEINRRVVYQRSLNITQYIVDQLNSGAPAPGVGTRPTVPPRPGGTR